MENLRGIAFMTLAMAGFAIEDAFIKQAALSIPTGQILLVIGLGGAGLFGLMAWRQGIVLVSPVLWSRPVMLRNGAELVGTLGFVTAITTIPLATASAILQVTPLAITMGAALVFGAAVGWRRWTAILVGIAGVLVIIRPGMNGFDLNALWALLGVAGLAGRDLAARAVPRTVSTLQLATYGFAMLVPTGAILLAVSGGARWPDPATWALLGGAVAIGMVAYFAITLASRTGEVAVVAPFRYSRLPFALVIGYVAFAEVPDAATYAGATLIVGSGLYTLVRERRLARAAAAEARQTLAR